MFVQHLFGLPFFALDSSGVWDVVREWWEPIGLRLLGVGVPLMWLLLLGEVRLPRPETLLISRAPSLPASRACRCALTTFTS